MPMTVKKLIVELNKIENKFLEVEVALIDKESLEPGIISINHIGKKVLIFLERKK